MNLTIPVTTSADQACWHLYMLRTPSGLLYTGITTDVARRLQQHQNGKGAKALQGKGELTLVFHKPAGNRSEASVLECQIKRLSKKQKEKLVNEQPKNMVEYLANFPPIFNGGSAL